MGSAGIRRAFVAAALLAAIASLSGCALGLPGGVTYVSDVGATLNGTVLSSQEDHAEYWFRYGAGTALDGETAHRGVTPVEDGVPVSQPIRGLRPETDYSFQVCASDDEESPPRTTCSRPRSFRTGVAGGRSGIVFVSEVVGVGQDIWVMNEDGSNPTNLTPNPGWDYEPTWSPDGRRIVFGSNAESESDIFVMNADGSGRKRLTTDEAIDAQPAWSPDGSKIAFVSFRGSQMRIWVMNADGTDQHAVGSWPVATGPAWSPDGTQIAFVAIGGFGNAVRVMNADGSNEENLTGFGANGAPAFSPLGDRIAWPSQPSGSPGDIYLMDRDGGNPVALLGDTPGDASPTWSPDGSRMAFDSQRGSSIDVFAMDAGGANLVNLTKRAGNDFSPAWSPHP